MNVLVLYGLPLGRIEQYFPYGLIRAIILSLKLC